MGKRQSAPYRPGHHSNDTAISIPVHLTCSSDPSKNCVFSLQTVYSVDTHLADVLQQIEKSIPYQFEIGAVSNKSFLNQRIAINSNAADQSHELKVLQYRSITNYAEKDVQSKGVHICIVSKSNGKPQKRRKSISNPSHGAGDIMEAIRKPLATLSLNNRENQPAPNRPSATSKTSDSLKKSNKVNSGAASRLSVRIEQLRESCDVGFIHFGDIMGTLRGKEVKLLHDLDADYVGTIQQKMTAPMRGMLMEWLLDVQWDLSLMDETVFAGINYIDVFLSKLPVDKKKLQLLGISAMMLASKSYEVRPQPLHEWLYLAHDQYSRKEVLAFERKILKCIDWNIFQVTPYNYSEPWMKILRVPTGDTVLFMFDLLIRAVYANALCLKHKVSQLTAAAIALSFVYLRRYSELDVGVLRAVAEFDVMGSDVIAAVNELFCSFIGKQRTLERKCNVRDGIASPVYAFFAGSDKEAAQKKYESGFVDVSDISFRRVFEEHSNKMKQPKKL